MLPFRWLRPVYLAITLWPMLEGSWTWPYFAAAWVIAELLNLWPRFRNSPSSSFAQTVFCAFFACLGPSRRILTPMLSAEGAWVMNRMEHLAFGLVGVIMFHTIMVCFRYFGRRERIALVLAVVAFNIFGLASEFYQSLLRDTGFTLLSDSKFDILANAVSSLIAYLLLRRYFVSVQVEAK